MYCIVNPVSDCQWGQTTYPEQLINHGFVDNSVAMTTLLCTSGFSRYCENASASRKCKTAISIPHATCAGAHWLRGRSLGKSKAGTKQRHLKWRGRKLVGLMRRMRRRRKRWIEMTEWHLGVGRKLGRPYLLKWDQRSISKYIWWQIRFQWLITATNQNFQSARIQCFKNLWFCWSILPSCNYCHRIFVLRFLIGSEVVRLTSLLAQTTFFFKSVLRNSGSVKKTHCVHLSR